MTEFARYISDRWGIAEPLAKSLCNAFTKGCSPFYLSDYDQSVASETELGQVCEVFDFLSSVNALAPKKKRALNALAKNGPVSPEQEERINLSISEAELDDILFAHRVNPRSLGHIALAKGLGPLADVVQRQDSTLSLEAAVKPYIGKHESLKTAEDVLNGVRDILVERFAADDTVRSMARDYGTEKGLLEVIPKNKKDKTYAHHAGKSLDIHGLVGKELLALLDAEERKEIRLKVSVQLFQITELLREHFITDPESEAFDLICSAIDTCWSNMLQPIVEKEVKMLVRRQSEEAVLRIIASEMSRTSLPISGAGSETYVAMGFFDPAAVSAVAVTSQGHLQGASNVGTAGAKNNQAVIERLRQFCARYHPAALLVLEEQITPETDALLTALCTQGTSPIEVKRIAPKECERTLVESPWIKDKFADLDEPMRKTLAMTLAHVKPSNLIVHIGVRYFSLHPMQSLVSPEKMTAFISRLLTENELVNGIPAAHLANSVLAGEQFMPADVAAELHKPTTRISAFAKRDLLSLPGMTEAAFRNIAGYVVVPQAEYILDRTLVHPDHFPWVAEIANTIGTSVDSLVADPEVVRSYLCEDPIRKIFIEKKLIGQLRAGQKYQSQRSQVVRRRLKLAEIAEGAVVSGRVTNIMPFGVFVDINAVCDGLIHISQLADTYVETPEQVVSLGDHISARVVKIDVKKRRISLSMKNMGNLAPKIRPSQGQLNTLADHFKNR